MMSGADDPTLADELGQVWHLACAIVAMACMGASCFVFSLKETWTAAPAVSFLVGVGGLLAVLTTLESVSHGSIVDQYAAAKRASTTTTTTTTTTPHHADSNIRLKRVYATICEKERRRAYYSLGIASALYCATWTCWLLVGMLWPPATHVEGIAGVAIGAFSAASSLPAIYNSDTRKSFASINARSAAICAVCVVTFCVPTSTSTSMSATALATHWAMFTVMFYACTVHALAFTNPGMRPNLLFCQSAATLHTATPISVMYCLSAVAYYAYVRFPLYSAHVAEKRKQRALQEELNRAKVQQQQLPPPALKTRRGASSPSTVQSVVFEDDVEKMSAPRLPPSSSTPPEPTPAPTATETQPEPTPAPIPTPTSAPALSPAPAPPQPQHARPRARAITPLA